MSENFIFSSFLLLVEISNNSVSAGYRPQRGVGEVLVLLVICRRYLQVLTGLFVAISCQGIHGLGVPEKVVLMKPSPGDSQHMGIWCQKSQLVKKTHGPNKRKKKKNQRKRPPKPRMCHLNSLVLLQLCTVRDALNSDEWISGREPNLCFSGASHLNYFSSYICTWDCFI